jgi:hypothetical protein
MRIAAYPRQISDFLWRVVPLSLIVVGAAYAVASQVVSPHRRLIKITVLFLLMVVMLRLETIYALYAFIVLMPFPSGVALTSTNVVLMTLVPLLWVIRARSMGQALFKRTPLDGFILFFLLAYVVSFFNAESTHALVMNLRMLWRQLAALGFFYLLVTFVDDEKKLGRVTKMVGVSASLLSITACIELFAPGSTLIPGWIGLPGDFKGEYGMRIEGLRAHGSVGSHSLLSDFTSMSLFFVVVHLLRSKNPIEGLVWVVLFAMSLTATLATANRGAFVALVVGIGYALWVFRRAFNPVRFALIAGAIVALFAGVQTVLGQFTYAASIFDRLSATTFEGIVPDNRGGAWLPALERSFEHIFIGHGAWYDTGSGLSARAWPHNAYIFNLYALGLLGLSAMLLLRYRVFKISFDQVRAHPPGAGNGLAANLMGILHVQLVMHFLHMMRTDFERPGDDVYIYIVWMLFGLVVATANIQSERARREAESRPGAGSLPQPSSG